MPTTYDNIEKHLLADLKQELAAGTAADVHAVGPDLIVLDLIVGGEELGTALLALLRGDPSTRDLPVVCRKHMAGVGSPMTSSACALFVLALHCSPTGNGNLSWSDLPPPHQPGHPARRRSGGSVRSGRTEERAAFSDCRYRPRATCGANMSRLA